MSKRGKFQYFDNCAICDAMRRADEAGRDLSVNELRDAFDEAAKSGKAVAPYSNPKFRKQR